MVEMVLKERRAWQVSQGHVELKGTLDQKGLIPTTEVGNSACGGLRTVGTWDLLRYVTLVEGWNKEFIRLEEFQREKSWIFSFDWFAVDLFCFFFFYRSASSTRREIVPLYEWFIKVIYTCVVTNVVSAGSSPLMEQNAVVRCPLTRLCGSETEMKITTDLEQ